LVTEYNEINNYLFPHLKAEIPELNSQSLTILVENKPYLVLDTLRNIVQKRTCAGACQICKDL